jgi:phage gp16-like protein
MCLCRDLGLHEDERRVVYESITGKSHISEMNDRDLARVITQLKSQPALNKSRTYKGEPMARSAVARKIRALWLRLRDAGVLTDSSETALKKYALARVGSWNLDTLSNDDASALINQLRSWVDRVERARAAAPVDSAGA